jgi:acyl carrier protein
MTTLSTLQDVIIAGHGLAREQLGPEVELTALGIDSLDFIELLFQVEDRFDIEIPGDNPADLQRVGDLVGYIDGLVAAQSNLAPNDVVAAVGG